MIQSLRTLSRDLLAECAEITLRGPRARVAVAAALAVGVALILALALHLQDVYWAGISAFVCMQSNQPQSLRKGVHRMIGTASGAARALILFPPIAYDHAATMLLLFCAAAIAIAGSLVSRYSYAWLLGGITTVMVVLGAIDDPTQALNIAFFRSSEIFLGTSVALAIAKWLLPAAAKELPLGLGWVSVFDPQSVVLGHAFRAGLGVSLVPVVWRIFELPNLSQMAISIGAVMAVPALSDSSEGNRRAVADRSLQRMIGCVIGGCLGLGVLTMAWAAYFPLWLLILMVGAAVGVQFETGRHGVKILAIQAEVALILTLTQGWGPAVSLLPAIDRVVGMLGAVFLLFVVGSILGPLRAGGRSI
jgi:uncharacterized membrane protein YccC